MSAIYARFCICRRTAGRDSDTSFKLPTSAEIADKKQRISPANADLLSSSLLSIFFFIFWRSGKSNRHPLKSELASPECARWFPFAGAIDLLSLLARRTSLRRRTERFLSAIASKDQLIYNFYNPINIALRAIFAIHLPSVVQRSIADVKRRTIVTRTAKRGPKRDGTQKWKQKVIHQHG